MTDGVELTYSCEALPLETGKLRFAADLSQAESIEDLTRRLYGAINSVFDSVIVGFDILDPDTHRPEQTSAKGASTFFLAKYDQVARDADPVLKQAVVNRDVAYNLAMMSEGEWRSLRIYREVFSLHRMVSIVYAPVVVAGKVVATLNLARTEDTGAFSQHELQDAKEVATFLGAQITSLQRRHDLEHQVGLFRGALDLANEAVIISDVRRAARYMNKAARHVLDHEGSGALHLDEVLVGTQESSDDGLVQRSAALDDGDAFVSFLRSQPRVDVLPEWLNQTLTAREAEVTLLVAKGLRDAEVADRLTLSVHTVKGYLREVFRRTGVSSRVELARMVVRTGLE